MKTDPTSASLLRALRRALAEAGAIHRRGAHRAISISHKGVVDIVTTVDHAAEKKILRILRGAFPDHGFLMEESGLHAAPSRYRWVGTHWTARSISLIACPSVACPLVWKKTVE